MKRLSVFAILFSCFGFFANLVPVLATSASGAQVEFSSALHFLTPAGDDVEVGPGIYEVEAAESWLKLVLEGEGSTGAILLDANHGPHEVAIVGPEVRTYSDPDHPELLHLALLMPGGTGLEAIGTTTGIRPRGLAMAFLNVKRQPPKVSMVIKPGLEQSGATTGQLAPPPSTGKPVDCGPYQKRIGEEINLEIPGKRSVALAIFQNRLHMVAVEFSRLSKYNPVMHWGKFQGLYHWQYDGETWKPYRDPSLNQEASRSGRIPDQFSKAGVALAVFQNRLHQVHISEARDLRSDPNDIWHSTFDGRRWTRDVKIPGQKSKTTPALAVWDGQLHMVHLGDSSNHIWHSINKGNGWTVNVRIPGKSSDKAPALGRITSGSFAGRLHMVYKSDANIEPQSLWHAQFDGRQWRRSVMIQGPLTKAAPTLVPYYPYGMHLIHLGKSSDSLWHMLFGQNKDKNNAVEWFDERPLLSEKSEAPVDVALFQGCYHMVSLKDDKLMHTTFATSDIHPNVR
ncbi:MAG: hypothetical protein AB7T38_06505 [Nitrospirales bacterium]